MNGSTFVQSHAGRAGAPKIIGFAITALAVLLNRVVDTPQQAGAYGCSFYQSLAVYRYRPVQKGKTRRNKYVIDDVKK